MPKVTFSLDDPTLQALETTAERLGKPKSLVVREAIAEYAAHAGRLTEVERRRMLKAFDTLVPNIPVSARRGVRGEIQKVRRERRQAGRLRG